MLKLGDVIFMSLLIDWYYNFHVTKYWLVSGGHYMYYLRKSGFHCIQICSKPTGIHTRSNSADANKTGTFRHTLACSRHRI